MLKACYEVQVQLMCILGLQPIQITLGFLLKTCQNWSNQWGFVRFHKYRYMPPIGFIKVVNHKSWTLRCISSNKFHTYIHSMKINIVNPHRFIRVKYYIYSRDNSVSTLIRRWNKIKARSQLLQKPPNSRVSCSVQQLMLDALNCS